MIFVETEVILIFVGNIETWRTKTRLNIDNADKEIFPLLVHFIVKERTQESEIDCEILLETILDTETVCNFQSMKSPVELNRLLSKFFCYMTWFVISPD